MLVLARRSEQSIVIRGNITLIVLGVERDVVRLGLRAPDDVHIRREELEPEGVNHKPHEKIEGMLVLTREAHGKGIVIGEDILIKILGADRGRIKVGIQAPADVNIMRGEQLLAEGRPHGSKERL